jgi:peptide subunit release factor RF-3
MACRISRRKSCAVSDLSDAMKAKKLKEALQQMAEEGVVQLFVPEDGSPAIVGVVGALQLDVLKERLKAGIRPAGRFRNGAVFRLPLDIGRR